MLNPRLKTVATFLPVGSTFADIGTDHASLPIFAVKNGCPFAVASDFNYGPYAAAQKNVRAAGLTQQISVRQGSGLATLQPGEVDVAVFAGMGGLLINELLLAQPQVVARLKGLILQPQLAVDKVRRQIYQLGWHIAAEALAKDGGHLYQIIYALPQPAACPSDFALTVGPCLLANRPAPFWSEHLERLLDRSQKVVVGLSSAKQRDDATLQAAKKLLLDLEKLQND